jgi:SAM-dependent methyltransferase/uncharacterized protein YbaR (Trm112 family)
MIESFLLEVELVCPKCRKLVLDKLIQFPLKLSITQKQDKFVEEGFFVCTNPQCKTQYPIIDGVPIIVKDLKDWIKGHIGATSLDDPVNTPELEAYLNNAIPQSNLKSLAAQYMNTHYGEYTNSKNLYQDNNKKYWKTIQTFTKSKHRSYNLSLELGCSVGRFTFEIAKQSKIAVGLDSNFYAIKEAVSIQRNRGKIFFEEKTRTLEKREVNGRINVSENVFFLVGDALDPPFRMESFDFIAALNLIDTIKVPLTLLGQMDALLSPEGELLVGSPYCWNAQITDPAEWLETNPVASPEMVRSILEGKISTQCGFRYKIEKEIQNLVWSIKNLDSHYSIFLSHLILAKKQPEALS